MIFIGIILLGACILNRICVCTKDNNPVIVENDIENHSENPIEEIKSLLHPDIVVITTEDYYPK